MIHREIRRKNWLDFLPPNLSITAMKRLLLCLALASLNLAAFAAEQKFDFKDPKGVNNVVFKTDAPLESINGTATNVSGTISFDPANPASLKGKLVVAAASLRVPNSMMQGHLQSAMWLDVAKFPDITFEAVSVANVKQQDNNTTADVTGTMTLHGVSKQMTVPVKITYLKDKLHDRFPQLQGDLLVIRAEFIVKRSDFNINKGQGEDKVSDEIKLSLAVAGQSPR
jgi:polyisoprenoid-binding protein YceI